MRLVDRIFLAITLGSGCSCDQTDAQTRLKCIKASAHSRGRGIESPSGGREIAGLYDLYKQLKLCYFVRHDVLPVFGM